MGVRLFPSSASEEKTVVHVGTSGRKRALCLGHCSRGVRPPRRWGSPSVRTKAPRIRSPAHRSPRCVRVDPVLLLQIKDVTLTATPRTHFPVRLNLHRHHPVQPPPIHLSKHPAAVRHRSVASYNPPTRRFHLPVIHLPISPQPPRSLCTRTHCRHDAQTPTVWRQTAGRPPPPPAAVSQGWELPKRNLPQFCYLQNIAPTVLKGSPLSTPLPTCAVFYLYILEQKPTEQV